MITDPKPILYCTVTRLAAHDTANSICFGVILSASTELVAADPSVSRRAVALWDPDPFEFEGFSAFKRKDQIWSEIPWPTDIPSIQDETLRLALHSSVDKACNDLEKLFKDNAAEAYVRPSRKITVGEKNETAQSTEDRRPRYPHYLAKLAAAETPIPQVLKLSHVVRIRTSDLDEAESVVLFPRYKNLTPDPVTLAPLPPSTGTGPSILLVRYNDTRGGTVLTTTGQCLECGCLPPKSDSWIDISTQWIRNAPVSQQATAPAAARRNVQEAMFAELSHAADSCRVLVDAIEREGGQSSYREAAEAYLSCVHHMVCTASSSTERGSLVWTVAVPEIVGERTGQDDPTTWIALPEKVPLNDWFKRLALRLVADLNLKPSIASLPEFIAEIETREQFSALVRYFDRDESWGLAIRALWQSLLDKIASAFGQSRADRIVRTLASGAKQPLLQARSRELWPQWVSDANYFHRESVRTAAVASVGPAGNPLIERLKVKDPAGTSLLDAAAAEAERRLATRVERLFTPLAEPDGTPPNAGVTFQVDRLGVQDPGAEDSSEDFLRQIAGFGIVLRRAVNGKFAGCPWRCPNIGRLHWVKSSQPPGSTPLAVVPAKLGYVSKLRQVSVTYDNRPLTLAMGATATAPPTARPGDAIDSPGYLFQPPEPPTSKPTDPEYADWQASWSPLPALLYGFSYEALAFVMGLNGALPAALADPTHPCRLSSRAATDYPPEINGESPNPERKSYLRTFDYQRRTLTGAPSLAKGSTKASTESKATDTEPQATEAALLPPIPESCTPIANELQIPEVLVHADSPYPLRYDFWLADRSDVAPAASDPWDVAITAIRLASPTSVLDIMLTFPAPGGVKTVTLNVTRTGDQCTVRSSDLAGQSCAWHGDNGVDLVLRARPTPDGTVVKAALGGGGAAFAIDAPGVFAAPLAVSFKASGQAFVALDKPQLLRPDAPSTAPERPPLVLLRPSGTFNNANFHVYKPTVDFTTWDRWVGGRISKELRFQNGASPIETSEERKLVWKEWHVRRAQTPNGDMQSELDDPAVHLHCGLAELVPVSCVTTDSLDVLQCDFKWKPETPGTAATKDQRVYARCRSAPVSVHIKHGTKPSLTLGESNTIVAEVPEGEVWELRLSAILSERDFESGTAMPSRFAPWVGRQLRRLAGDRRLAPPLRITIESIPNSVSANEHFWPTPERLWHALTPRFVDGSAALHFTPEGEEPRHWLRFIKGIDVLRQAWRWNGQPVEPVPAEALVHGLEGADRSIKEWSNLDGNQRKGLPAIIRWELMAFTDRSDTNSALSFARLPALWLSPPDRRSAELFRQSLDNDLRAGLIRFTITARSRYEGIERADQRVDARLNVAGPGDKKSRFFDTRWRRLFVPCRLVGEIPKPRIRFALPLTRAVEDGEAPPGILVILDEPWYAVAGLAEELKVELLTVGSPPDGLEATARDRLLEFGPDPAVLPTMSEPPHSAPPAAGYWTPLDPRDEAVPSASEVFSIRPPIGCTFDALSAAPRLTASSFLLEVRQDPVRGTNGALRRPPIFANPAWAFAKLRFTRYVCGTLSASGPRESNPTDPIQVQFLPDRTTPLGEFLPWLSYTVISDGKTLIAQCAKAAPPAIRDRFNALNGILHDERERGFLYWLLFTQRVVDALGTERERYWATAILENATTLRIVDAHDGINWSNEGIGPGKLRARVLRIQVPRIGGRLEIPSMIRAQSTPADGSPVWTVWDLLFGPPETDEQRGDAKCRIVSVSAAVTAIIEP
jgi:hypothetical protein